MTKVRLAALFSLLLVVPGGWGATSRAATSGPLGGGGEKMSVIVQLREQANLTALPVKPRAARLYAAIVALQATANRSQRRLLDLLRARSARDRSTVSFRFGS